VKSRRLLQAGAVLGSLLFVAAACGNDDDGGSDTTVAAETTAVVETTAVADTTPVDTTPADTTPVDTAAATTDTGATVDTGANATPDTAAAAAGNADGKVLKVAVLTPGLTNDGSFNQAALDGIEKLKAAGLVEYEIREKLADPAASEPVIREYATNGYDLIIGHGIELQEPILKVAANFPNVHFAGSGGPDLAGKLTENVDGWTYDFGQQGYLTGFVAGKLTGVTKIGAVGGPDLDFLKAAHKGFKEGVKDSGATAEVTDVFTGSFDDVQKAVEATKGLISQGANVIWCSGDGICNGVATAASEGNALALGITGDAGGLAAKVNVAAVKLDMSVVFQQYVDDIKNNTFGKKFISSDLANKGLVLEVNPALADKGPADLGTQVDALVAELASGAKKLPNFFAP